MVGLRPSRDAPRAIARTFDYPAGNIAYAGGLSNASIGWRFSVSTPVLVTDLGIFDYAYNGVGLATAHDVAIWEWFSGTELAFGTVPSGTGGTPVSSNGNGIWWFVPLGNPVLLDPGTYVIGAQIGAREVIDAGANLSNGLTTASPIHYLDERSNNILPTFNMPTFVDNSGGVFGPNFEFITPEPSSLLLIPS